MAAVAVPLILVSPARATEDPRDAAAVRQVLQSVLETEKSGVEVPWSSSVTGNAGMVMVERTYFRKPDQPCRDYKRTIVTPSGDKMTINGTGCRLGSENWNLEEEAPVTEVAKKTPDEAVKKPKSITPPDKAGAPKDKAAKDTPPKSGASKPNDSAAVAKASPVLEYRLPTKSDL